jgi:predicted Zn-dependent protease
MSETIEDGILQTYVLDWLHWAKKNLPPNAREIKAIWTDL